MRRFLGSVLLAVLLAASLLVAGPAPAAPAETGESSPSIWQALLELLRPIFGAEEGDGTPGWDPNGLQTPPPGGGAEVGSGDGSGSGNADGTPGMDPDG